MEFLEFSELETLFFCLLAEQQLFESNRGDKNKILFQDPRPPGGVLPLLWGGKRASWVFFWGGRGEG